MPSQAVRAQPRASATAAVPLLLAADDVKVRLTLEAVLGKSGYQVDSAASSAEAMEKIESGQYALVLCDLRGESADACSKVLRVARAQAYQPATAVVRSSEEADGNPEGEDHFLVEPVDIQQLLTDISNLIGARAARRSR